jgi:lysophospholipase L1-like esterase
VTLGAPDNGCNGTGPNGEPPFKPAIGLHTNYPGMSQLDFALSQLASNKKIDVVTLSIGGNDMLLLVKRCAGDPACVQSQLGVVLAQYADNLGRILTAIRAKYRGTIVLVLYFSPNPALNPVAQALNSTIVDVGKRFNARFADGYTAFQLASAFSGGNACAAGLLAPLAPGVCDVHPTLNGQRVLGAAVVAALGPSAFD